MSTDSLTSKKTPCRGTASVAVMGVTACATFLLLLTPALRHIPLFAPSADDTPGWTMPKLTWWETQRFNHHVNTRLSRYRRQFERVARIYDIPWTLLAAQAYQESRWDRHAVSPTGVRGIMMLTRVTASSLGIRNRLDPVKSIEGGARYLKTLKQQLSSRVAAPERIWIALAAYNVGMGHIRDTQRLAQQLGENPYSWTGIKTILPLVSQKKYYQALPYGYAQGWEPVQYVNRIRAYHALLEQHFNQV